MAIGVALQAVGPIASTTAARAIASGGEMASTPYGFAGSIERGRLRSVVARTTRGR